MLVLKETPIPEVCEAFKVARGMVQALQESAGRFASMVSVFCERLGWHDLEGLVAKFQNRVSFGVRAEIVELTSIPFVKVFFCSFEFSCHQQCNVIYFKQFVSRVLVPEHSTKLVCGHL